MKWTKQAEEALSRVPFFVRRRVRKRVEAEATRANAVEVTLDHVHTCRRRFLENMEDEVQGHRVEACFGSSGCPNRVLTDDGLAREIEKMLEGKRLKNFLKARVPGPLKLHHELRVSISDCPNACSRPQIVDLGMIAAVRPRINPKLCTGCAACVAKCKESAISLSDEGHGATLNASRCVSCGQCIRACPAAALEIDAQGYRVLLGGKLGRHPQLASELPGIYSKEEALEIVGECLEHYLRKNVEGERFGEILKRTGFGFLDEIRNG